jgi:hypothetical protein
MLNLASFGDKTFSLDHTVLTNVRVAAHKGIAVYICKIVYPTMGIYMYASINEYAMPNG